MLLQTFKSKGMVYLDAPVSGGPEGATKGTLSIMVGGTAAHHLASDYLISVDHLWNRALEGQGSQRNREGPGKA
jgi:6-phosphogluconate dehydrogenase (decarboxylating)